MITIFYERIYQLTVGLAVSVFSGSHDLFDSTGAIFFFEL